MGERLAGSLGTSRGGASSVRHTLSLKHTRTDTHMHTHTTSSSHVHLWACPFPRKGMRVEMGFLRAKG